MWAKIINQKNQRLKLLQSVCITFYLIHKLSQFELNYWNKRFLLFIEMHLYRKKKEILLVLIIIHPWDIKVAEETPANKHLGPLKWSLKLSVMTEYITAYYLQKTPIMGLRGVEERCKRVLSVQMMNGCTLSGWHMCGVADGTRVNRQKTRLDREHVLPLTGKNNTQHSDTYLYLVSCEKIHVYI